MFGPYNDNDLKDALERLIDMALPENVGQHITKEDQRACFIVVLYHQMLRGKANDGT